MGNNKKPLVSIGMPVFNEGQFIGKAIDSLLQQDFEDFELIISDNMSTDRTFEICTEYKDKDRRIKLHRNERNLGGANLLQVIKLSSGKYCMMAGGHDMWAANALNRYLDGFRRLANCVLVYSPATYIDKSDNIIKVDAPDNLKEIGKFSTFKNIITGSISSNAFCGLMKTDSMLKTSLSPACIGADTILLSELSLYGDFSQLKESFYFRRENRAKESIQQKISRYTDGSFIKLHDHWKPIFKKQPYEHMVYKYLCMVQNNNLSLEEQSILNESVLDAFRNWGVQPSNIFKFILEIHRNKSKFTQPIQAAHLIGYKRAKQRKQFLDTAIFRDSLKETKYNVLKNDIWQSIAFSDNKMSNKKFPSDRKYDVCYILYDTSKWGGVKGALVQINGLVDRGYRVCLISKSGPPEWFPLKGDFIESPELKVEDIPISDIIIATWHPTVPIAYIAKKGIVVHYCRGYEGEYPNLSDNQRTQIEKIYKLPTVKIANSPHIVSFLKKNFTSDVYLVRNDINHDIFYPQQNVSKRDLHERWRVLIVGPYEIAWKGIQDCIRACNILKQKYGLDIEIIRASQFPITNEEIALLKSYVADHYKYFHNLSEQQMAQLYNSCDLLLCGSYPIVESFGRPVMEALACGLPTVVTNIHAFTDYDSTHNYAIFVVPGDIDAMADAAKKVTENANLRENLTRRGLEVSAEYNNDRTLDDLELALSDIYSKYGKNNLKPNLESGKMKKYYDFSRPEVQTLVKTTSKIILDVGCASGNLGAQLKASLGAEVWGIEVVERAAKTAEKKLDRVLCGSIEKVLKLLPDHYFDTIIFADILEHLIDPLSVLEQIKPKLSQDGEIIASIPNVRHWSVLKDLLEGRWDYVDAGILDRTHLRFFTKSSLLQMFKTAGFCLEKLQETVIQGCEVPESVIDALGSSGIDTRSLEDEGKIYQYLLVVKPENYICADIVNFKLTSIIIITHNQLEYTKRCIGSIFTHTKEAFELIVVDNGSTDGTVEYLELEASRRKSEDGGLRPDVRIKIIKNSENLGFAAGNNQGIAAARGDYILLMNNDVVVTPGWLSTMIACAEKSPMIGMVGPKSNYVSGPQFVENVSYDINNLNGLERFSSEFAQIHSGKTTPFWRVVGFCMLIKRQVIEKIGGLDERYGLGNFEDDDFSLRATLAGYESRIAEDSFVHHFGNRTFLAAQIDYKKSLHMNWEIFKEKWGISKDLPYGSSYDLSFLVKDGFIHSKHHFSIGGMPDAQISKEKSIFSSSIQEEYLEIQKMIAKGKKEDAKEALEKLLLAEPDYVLAHNDLGALYFQDGDKAKALKHYERTVQLQPGNVNFLKNLADFYYVEMGRVEDALRIYVKILEANPEDVETLLITGHICVAMENFQDAKIFYNRVLEIEPGHQDARQFLEKLNSMEACRSEIRTPQALYDEIQPLLNDGDPHRAIAALEHLLELFPDYALAYNDLGVLHYFIGDKEKAQQYYERAVEMMPENINFQKNLADFYYIEIGRIEEALNIYVGILNTHPRDIETLLATGQICVALEKPDDAKAFYHRVLELESGNEAAGNYLQDLDEHPMTKASSPSVSAKTVSVVSEMAASNDLEPYRSAAENRAATASIIISLDGIQNCVKECTKSAMAHTPDPHEILLINRGATNGMLKWVQQLVKDNDQYRIIECTRQASLAESLNRAVQKASGDVIVLMHNDAVVPEGWLNAFKILIKLEPNVGVMGPMSNQAEGIQQMIPFEDSDRAEFESIAKVFYKQNQYRRVATWKLSNFCLAFPRELPDKIGYFDEQFASEEVVIEDFCKRATLGGHRNLIAADTYVHHYDRHKAKKSASARNRDSHNDRKKYKEKWNSAQNPQAKALLTVHLLARAEELSQKGQIDPAVEVLLGGIGVQPEDPRFYLALSEILLAVKKFQDAKDALTEMPVADENQEMRKAQLLAYAEEGLENYEAAHAQIEQVLLMNPDHAPALNLKGILAYRNNDCPSAEKYFNRAIDSDPGYGEPYTNLGMLSLATDRPQDALQFFEKSFRLTPTDLDIATNYHTYIGATADFIRAEVLAHEAAALYPNNQKIKYMLIDFLVQQGKYEMAMPEIEDAIIKFGTDNGIIGAALKVREKLGAITIQKLSKKAAVSVCMIIKDEEKYLARCLASVKPIVDEMIVVDTGSTDRSKDIAIAFGAKVYDFDWKNDFAEARNYSIAKAAGEWILILDGDEVISPLDHEHFDKIVQKTPRVSIAYSIITRNYNKLANIVGWMPNDGTYPEEEAAIGWLPSEKVRLFYGKDQIWFEGPVHELVDPVLKRKGIEIKKCPIPVHHYGRLDKEKLDRKGEIYFDIGRKKLSAMGDDLNALRELAVQATILEKNQEAFELWQRLLALNPNSHLAAIAYVNMGTIYSRLGKFEDALDAGKKAVECDPNLKEARYNHAMAELHCGNAPQAIRVLNDLLKGFPDYPPARFILSAAYCCADQKEKGVEGIIKLRDTPMGAHLDIPCLELAQSLISAGKMEYSLWVLGAAIESDIVNPQLLTLFKECLNMNETMQKCSHIPQPPQVNLQEAVPENLPQ